MRSLIRARSLFIETTPRGQSRQVAFNLAKLLDRLERILLSLHVPSQLLLSMGQVGLRVFEPSGRQAGRSTLGAKGNDILCIKDH